MLRPSGAKRGCPTLRSMLTVKRRGGDAPPSAEITARCAVAYPIKAGSTLVTYAIDLPSGLQAGCSSGPGLVVTGRAFFPCVVSSAATIQMSVLRLASASAVRLETNAKDRPSGLQAGSLSS